MATATQEVKGHYETLGLHEVFSPEDREIECQTNPLAVVHWGIASDEPLPKIVERMEELKEKCKEALNTPYSDLKLTALHFGVLKDRLDLVSELLSRGARPDLTDKFDFSPWLHTALLTEGLKMRTLLESHGYRPKQKEKVLWDQLRQRGGLQECPLPSDRISYRGKKGDAVPLTAAVVRDQLKLQRYTDFPLCSPAQYPYLWQTFFYNREYDQNEGLFFQEVQRQLSKGALPKFLIAHNPLFGQRVRSNSLFAQSTIGEGEPLGWLGGAVQKSEVQIIKENDDHWLLFEKLVLEEDPKSEYSVRLRPNLDLSTLDSGNLIRYCNDGWPLAAVEYFQGGRMAMFALQKIDFGTEVTWDLGPGCRNLKWGDYCLLNREMMVKFFREHPSLIKLYHEGRVLVQRMEALDSKNTMEKTLIKNLYSQIIPLKLQMNFVLNTPAALIYLAVQNLISAEECLLLLQEPDSKGFTRMSDYPSHYIWLLTVIWTLKDFQEQTRKLPEVQRNQLAAYYIQNILEKEGISVIRATRGLHELVIYLKEGRLTEFMGQSWVKRLKSYDWQKDPGALFARYDPELGLHIRKEVYAMIGQIRPLAHFINEVQKKVVVDVQKKQ